MQEVLNAGWAASQEMRGGFIDRMSYLAEVFNAERTWGSLAPADTRLQMYKQLIRSEILRVSLMMRWAMLCVFEYEMNDAWRRRWFWYFTRWLNSLLPKYNTDAEGCKQLPTIYLWLVAPVDTPWCAVEVPLWREVAVCQNDVIATLHSDAARAIIYAYWLFIFRWMLRITF